MNRSGKWKPPYFSVVVLVFEQKAVVSRIWNSACFLEKHLRRSDRARIPQVPEEHDNDPKDECKAGSENRDSDRRNDRRIPGSKRSTSAYR